MVPLCMSSLHMWKLIGRVSDSEQCDYRGLDANEEGKTARIDITLSPIIMEVEHHQIERKLIFHFHDYGRKGRCLYSRRR